MVNLNIIKEKYKLETNPFYQAGGDLIDRKNIRKELYQKIKILTGSTSTQMLFLNGPYGIGKTMLLQQIDEDIKNKKIEELKEDNVLSVYLRIMQSPHPPNYVVYIHNQIFRNLGLTFFQDILKQYNAINKNADTLSKIDTNFLNAFTKLDTEPTHAWNYLIGEALSAAVMKELDVASGVYSAEEASRDLISLLRVLNLLNYHTLILFVDEVDNLFTLVGKKKVAEVLVSLRDIYDLINNEINSDKNITQLIFILSGTNNTRKDILDLSSELPAIAAFSGRVILGEFQIPGFLDEDTEELIRAKLNTVRTASTDLHPFTKEYIEFITKNTRGNPRDILNRTAFILDEASDQDLSVINGTDAEKILNKLNLSLP